MQGKKPTKKQKIFLQEKRLNGENWFVCKDMGQEMLLKHRKTGKYRMIGKY